MPSAITTPSQWVRLLLGLAATFAIFHGSALALGSDLGQEGLIVGVLVVASTLGVERLGFGSTMTTAARAIGLGRPRSQGVALAAGISLLMLLVIPAFVGVTGSSATLRPDTLRLLPGLFAQAGVAEEVLFRGYLFGHLRRGRTFWRAAGLSMLPFVAVHLLLFFTMPWPIALAAMLLAVVLSFPLARLLELGGGTIWAPAILHFVAQGVIKVVVVSGDLSPLLPLVWMAASALVPLLVFLARRPAM